jgi:hypothetical protein
VTGPRPDDLDRPSRARRLICLAALASMLPYLLLKAAWVAGSTVGLADPTAFDNPTYLVANTLTLLADCAAAALVLALTYRWGLRVPAWLVLLPMWIATGLLGPIVALTVVAVPLSAVAGGGGGGGSGPDALQGWVFPVVYGGFAVQGLLIAVAFVLHARRRWPALFRAGSTAAGRGRRGGVRTGSGDGPATGPGGAAVLTGLGGALATVAGLASLAWCFGLDAGLGGPRRPEEVTDRAMFGVFGGFALAAVLAVPLLARCRRRGRAPWPALALAFAGTGSMVGWGGYFLLVTAAKPSVGTLALSGVDATKLLAGLLLAAGLRAGVRSRLSGGPGSPCSSGTPDPPAGPAVPAAAPDPR